MKRFLAISCLITLLAMPITAQASTCTHPFTDITGNFAEDAICELYQEGVVQGYSDKNFLPNKEVTRAEFVQMLVTSMGYNVYAIQSAAFSDTATSDWYYAVVSFAHSKGIVTGYSDNTFKPNASITRAEAIAMLVSTSGYVGTDTSDLNHSFYDVNAQDWFATALAVALDYDIIEGYGDGSFRPNNPLSRAEATVIIVKALNTIL